MIRELALLFIHLVVTIARLLGPGGARSVVAESLLVKHQLLILNRSRARAPDLRPSDRFIVGLCAILVRPARLLRAAIILKPSTILGFHRTLVKRKYRLLFTPVGCNVRFGSLADVFANITLGSAFGRKADVQPGNF